jgi:hypothetical protein
MCVGDRSAEHDCTDSDIQLISIVFLYPLITVPVTKGLTGHTFMTLALKGARESSLNEQGRNLEKECRVGDPSF